jgi:hypothetical protein
MSIQKLVEKASPRIKVLPRDSRGFPIPWFVKPEHDPPDFRVLRDNASFKAHNLNICWICGQSLGSFKAHVLGPMGALQRSTTEAACHKTCAEFAAVACPFIANPNMNRSPRALPEGTNTFEAELDNPTFFCIYVMKGAQHRYLSRQGNAPVWHLQEPVEVYWYRKGKLLDEEYVRTTLIQISQRLATRLNRRMPFDVGGLLRVSFMEET